MTRPKLLDAFCCQGGAWAGYHQAGFDVTGIDNDPRVQKYYPGRFIHGDAIAYIAKHGHQYDAIHASPPCQALTRGNAGKTTPHLNLIPATRAACEKAGVPYVIENVEHAAPHLNDPTTLCWTMFNPPGSVEDVDGTPLQMFRHRLFETNWPLAAPFCNHANGVQVAGCYGGGRRDAWEARNVRHGGYVPKNRNVLRALMGIDWPTTEKGLFEALPPVYTEHIGRQFLAHLETRAA